MRYLLLIYGNEQAAAAKSPEAQAFDLSKEPKEIYDIYNTGKFGLGCLLARRLLATTEGWLALATMGTAHL